jgi:NADPH:quinone reductase-like Zn-dependent oxidoreductase
MRAIRYDEFGGYEQLRLVEVPEPDPGDGQVLVRMRLAGVNPLDNTVRSGKLPFAKTLPIIPGGGGVGEVADPGGSAFSAGDAVLVSGGGYGLTADGTWREYLPASPEHLLRIPDGLTAESVAAMSTGAGYLTAYLALTELVPFKPGQSVLSPGIGGAVGQGTVEVAKTLGASAAISTASRTSKAERGRADGHEVIDLSREPLRDGVRRLTGGRGVDVIIDGVGGPLTGDALGCLAPGGSLIVVGYAGGTQASIDVTDVIWRRARIYGFMFSLFSPATIAAANRALFGLLSAGGINPVVAQSFPLDKAAEAQRHLIEDRPYGRVLLSI